VTLTLRRGFEAYYKIEASEIEAYNLMEAWMLDTGLGAVLGAVLGASLDTGLPTYLIF
jgi:hypothetical protein